MEFSVNNLKPKAEQQPGFLKILILGFIIGIAAIVPGLSGGVLAISLGIYPKLISSVTNLKSEFKKSISFLIPCAAGALLGIFVFGTVMKPLLENYEHSVIWLFMGLIVGSIPSLIGEATEKGFCFLYLIPLFVSLIIGTLLTTATEQKFFISEISPLTLIVGGGILALGAIIPGISSSFILMQMGIYDKIISAFVSFEWLSMLWISLGAVVFFAGTVKLINMAFNKFHGYAYFAALGFLLSTMFAVYPGITSVWDIVLFVTGVLIVYFFQRITKKSAV